MISVQKGAWKEDGQNNGHDSPISVKTVSWQDAWNPDKTTMLGILEDSLEGEEDITKADILISVGRGLGNPENFPSCGSSLKN